MLNGVAHQGSNLIQAGCLAAALHLALFYFSFHLMPASNVSKVLSPLSVVIQLDSDEQILKPELLEEAPKATQAPDPIPEELQQYSKPLEQQTVIRQALEHSESPHRVPTIHSQSFKNFLMQESDPSLKKNQQQLDVFNQSFELPAPGAAAEQPSQRTLVSHLSKTGVGMTEDKHGNRTCYALLHNMLDATAGPMILSKDCTPPKKIELDLNKPNNGWMER